MPEPLLVVRADARPGVGAGHVRRALSLAEAWRADGGDAVLAHVDLGHELAQRAVDVGVGLVALADADPATLAELVRRLRPAWVSLDGYDLRVDHQRAAASAGAAVAVVDDHGSVGAYDADLVIDQNLGADAATYASRRAGATLLLGPRFALLRPQFWLEPAPRERRDRPRVLVALGGMPDSELGAIAAAVDAEVGDAETVVLAGVDDVAGLLATCDLAVSAAGSTVWELCRFGIPMVLVAVARNQVPVATRLAAAGAAIDAGQPEAGWHRAAAAVRALLNDDARRAAMSTAGQALVDGVGARRVVAAMRRSELQLRPARAADTRLLWAWANDPSVRSSSFDTSPIPWADHVRWFEQALSSPETSIYVAELGPSPVGQIRFQRKDDVAELSFSVAVERRGGGLAAPLLRAGAARYAAESTVREVRGAVRLTNEASLRAFRAAGFQQVGTTHRRGVEAAVFACGARRP